MVANLIADNPEFQWLGFVPDIDSVITACHAVLFPIDVAVGNRSRILTALCKGALVIAHRNVALGNPALVDGRTCALAATPEEFIDRMVLLGRGRALGARGCPARPALL